MGFWEKNQDYAAQVAPDGHQSLEPQANHESKFSHEALAGTAAAFAFHEYEKKQEENGEPVEHKFAKEALVGLIGGFADKLVETKGRDEWDQFEAKREVKKQAEKQVEGMYDEQYGQNGGDSYVPAETESPKTKWW